MSVDDRISALAERMDRTKERHTAEHAANEAEKTDIFARLTMLENYVTSTAADRDENTPADTLAWRAEVAMFAAIGEDVAEQARALFEDCGEPEDYCHQTRLVFGGQNRIKLTRWGWTAEPGHCSERFLARFVALTRRNP